MFIPLPFPVVRRPSLLIPLAACSRALTPLSLLLPDVKGIMMQVHGKGIPLGTPPWSLVHPFDFGTLWLWRSLSPSNATNSPPCRLLANPSTPRSCSSTTPLWGLGNRHPPVKGLNLKRVSREFERERNTSPRPGGNVKMCEELESIENWANCCLSRS